MTGLKGHIRGEFVPEWGAVAVLALVGALFSARAGLHFTASFGAYLFVPLILLARPWLSRFNARAGLALEFLALVIATDLAVRVATYAASALAGPLWDAQFVAADAALGFHWKSWFDFVVAHPILGVPLGFLYYRIGLFALALMALLAIKQDVKSLREIFWLLLLCSLFTVLGAGLMPVLGPYHTYNLADACGLFVRELEKLRAGHDLTFPLGALTGVVQCPSFHTALALALVWGYRNQGRIGIVMIQLNLFLLLGVPVFGGHYLTDMLAGAGVFALSLAAVRLAPRLKLPRFAPLPVAARS